MTITWVKNSIQHYVIKFVNDLRQVSGFLKSTPVSSTNKTDSHDITEILLKVALSTITLIHESRNYEMNSTRITESRVFGGCSRHQQHFNYIVAIRLIGGRKLPRLGQVFTNFNTWGQSIGHEPPTISDMDRNK